MLEKPLDFKTIIRPETEFENLLIATPEFQKGYDWGMPRFGHPEGKVGLHVREVLDNIEVLELDPSTRRSLRLVALAHDTFKFQEFKFGKRWRHHGLLARDFMERYLMDSALLDIIELHDEAFYVWRAFTLEGKMEEAHLRLKNLIEKIGDHLPLYFLFYKCDTKTGDKVQAPLFWFEELMREMGVIV